MEAKVFAFLFYIPVCLGRLDAEQGETPSIRFVANKQDDAAFPADRVHPLCSGQVVTQTTCDTWSEGLYDEIVTKTVEMHDSLAESCSVDSCPRGDLIGCILRFSGHDLMDFRSASGGGSDGCIDFNDQDNKGLEECISGDENTLGALFAQFCTRVSFADLSVIAAEALMMRASSDWDANNKRSPTLDFRSDSKFGRTTATTCTPPHLPDPENSCDAVKIHFIDAVGLDTRLAVALMGAHTVGRARLENSGFDGFWVDADQGVNFGNEYYQQMYGAGWVPHQNDAGKWQWMRTDSGDQNAMMLNTDMCLGHNTDSGVIAAVEGPCCLWYHPEPLGDAPPQCPGDAGQVFPNCCSNNRGHPDADGVPTYFNTSICNRDSHNPSSPLCDDINGPCPATEAVEDYAANETEWKADFLRAWVQATENGRTGLFSTCDAAGSTTATGDEGEEQDSLSGKIVTKLAFILVFLGTFEFERV